MLLRTVGTLPRRSWLDGRLPKGSLSSGHKEILLQLNQIRKIYPPFHNDKGGEGLVGSCYVYCKWPIHFLRLSPFRHRPKGTLSFRRVPPSPPVFFKLMQGQSLMNGTELSTHLQCLCCISECHNKKRPTKLARHDYLIVIPGAYEGSL